MKPFISSILYLAFLTFYGCAEFQSQERNKTAINYNELDLWIDNTNEIKKNPAAPKLKSSSAQKKSE